MSNVLAIPHQRLYRTHTKDGDEIKRVGGRAAGEMSFSSTREGREAGAYEMAGTTLWDIGYFVEKGEEVFWSKCELNKDGTRSNRPRKQLKWKFNI